MICINQEDQDDLDRFPPNSCIYTVNDPSFKPSWSWLLTVTARTVLTFAVSVLPICPYCKNSRPHNKWRVINRVKRKGKGYDVKQIHIYHAILALSDDEFELLMRLLKSSSDTEIKQHRSAWIQSMHQGMGKGAETGATRRTSLEWFNDC